MRVVAHLVGVAFHQPPPEWPDSWPVPAVGDAITLPRIDVPLGVRAVDWHPEGEPGDPEPFARVVIGLPLPS